MVPDRFQPCQGQRTPERRSVTGVLELKCSANSHFYLQFCGAPGLCGYLFSTCAKIFGYEQLQPRLTSASIIARVGVPEIIQVLVLDLRVICKEKKKSERSEHEREILCAICCGWYLRGTNVIFGSRESVGLASRPSKRNSGSLEVSREVTTGLLHINMRAVLRTE